jgi:hypothetical protein
MANARCASIVCARLMVRRVRRDRAAALRVAGPTGLDRGSGGPPESAVDA